MLAVIETHPVQDRAPVYRALQRDHGVPVTAIYGSDFSIVGYRDPEFQTVFSWDTDLLSGYDATFLSRAQTNAPIDLGRLPTAGLGRALRAVRARAVLLVGYSPQFHRVAWYEAWRHGCPILFRGETNDANKIRSHPRAWLRSAALRLIYSRASACLYIGKHSRAHFERLGVPAHRLYFSPYSVDESTFEHDERDRARLRPDARLALGLDEQRIALLYSGKLASWKGVDLIVPAVRALPPALRDRVVVLFLGDGDQRAALAAAAALEPIVATRFLGFQNQRHLSRYYHAADLLLLPSHGESWGLVVNEALLHGLPCVASDRVGSAADLVSGAGTGVVFPSGSTADLADAIASAVSLTQSVSVRDRCRRKVRDYSVDRAAAGIAAAYRMVTAQVAGHAVREPAR